MCELKCFLFCCSCWSWMLMSDPFNLKLVSSKILSFSFSYLRQLKQKTQGTKLWLWFDFKVKFEKKSTSSNYCTQKESQTLWALRFSDNQLVRRFETGTKRGILEWIPPLSQRGKMCEHEMPEWIPMPDIKTSWEQILYTHTHTHNWTSWGQTIVLCWSGCTRWRNLWWWHTIYICQLTPLDSCPLGFIVSS